MYRLQAEVGIIMRFSNMALRASKLHNNCCRGLLNGCSRNVISHWHSAEPHPRMFTHTEQ